MKLILLTLRKYLVLVTGCHIQKATTYNITLDSKSKTAMVSRIYGYDKITKTKPKESFKSLRKGLAIKVSLICCWLV